MSEPIDYKKKCEEYEKRMGIGLNDPAKDGYLVLVNILRQQNEYLGEFSFSLKMAVSKAESEKSENLKEKSENLLDAFKEISSGKKVQYDKDTKRLQLKKQLTNPNHQT